MSASTWLVGNFSGSISRKGRLPVTAYRTDKWRREKEGDAEKYAQRSSDGQSTPVDFAECQWCVIFLLQIRWSNPRGKGHRGCETE